MTDWYAPNQQAVRADGSGPAEEGTGGSPARAKRSRSKKAEKADEETAPEPKAKAKD